jgi:hypothetical protein
MPSGRQQVPDSAGVRLRELTAMCTGSSRRINRTGRSTGGGCPEPCGVMVIGYTHGSCFFEPLGQPGPALTKAYA